MNTEKHLSDALEAARAAHEALKKATIELQAAHPEMAWARMVWRELRRLKTMSLELENQLDELL